MFVIRKRLYAHPVDLEKEGQVLKYSNRIGHNEQNY